MAETIEVQGGSCPSCGPARPIQRIVGGINRCLDCRHEWSDHQGAVRPIELLGIASTLEVHLPALAPRLRRAADALAEATSSRAMRQQRVHNWCAAAFGDTHARSVPQRGVRLVEEALEAAQAAGCQAEMLHRLVDHVFGRPVGELRQELGGVGLTLLALAAAADLDADSAEREELERVLSKPLEHFTARNAAKDAAGFSVIAAEAEGGGQ